jgi:hypothetical protein
MISAAKGEDISDPNDLDKEIALLEQQLKTATNKDLPKKTARVVSIFYHNSVQKVISNFLAVNKKFNKLYSRTNYRSSLNNVESKEDFIFTENIYHYKIEYNHISLKYEGLEQVNNTSSISIDFKSEYYAVQNSNQSILIKKNYNEQLTDQEIKSLVEAETNLHKELIAQKIKEYQEKK